MCFLHSCQHRRSRDTSPGLTPGQLISFTPVLGSQQNPIPIPAPRQPRMVEPDHALLRGLLEKLPRGRLVALRHPLNVRNHLRSLPTESRRAIRPVRKGRHKFQSLKNLIDHTNGGKQSIASMILIQIPPLWSSNCTHQRWPGTARLSPAMRFRAELSSKTSGLMVAAETGFASGGVSLSRC